MLPEKLLKQVAEEFALAMKAGLFGQPLLCENHNVIILILIILIIVILILSVPEEN